MKKIASDRDAHPECVEAARRMYKAYLANSDGKSWDGKTCPPWESLTPAVRGHWCAAATECASSIFAEERGKRARLEERAEELQRKVDELQARIDAFTTTSFPTIASTIPPSTQPLCRRMAACVLFDGHGDVCQNYIGEPLVDHFEDVTPPVIVVDPALCPKCGRSHTANTCDVVKIGGFDEGIIGPSGSDV